MELVDSVWCITSQQEIYSCNTLCPMWLPPGTMIDNTKIFNKFIMISLKLKEGKHYER